MRSLLVVDAAEYNAATDRINSALEVLRDEMKSLRQQDVTLMRQFITMNDAIRSISKDQKSISNDQKAEKRRAKRLRNRSVNVSASLNLTTPSRPIPLVRQQSVPRYCDVIPEVRERTWSCSSDEESCDSLSGSVTSLDEDSSFSESSITSAVPVFQSPLITRQRSRSMKTPVSEMARNSVNDVEQVLKSNVKLWKHAQSHEESSDSDCVFDESEEEKL